MKRQSRALAEGLFFMKKNGGGAGGGAIIESRDG